jgi:molybdate transport system regulatory protein
MIDLRIGRAPYCTCAAARIIANVRATVRPRIRVVLDDGTIVLGPGKADLLEAISRTGSIRAAAESLDMSYMRAWNLVRTMNAAFRSPLVEKVRGGAEQGGAQLTERGERVVGLYRRMEAKAEKAIAGLWDELRKEI